MGDRAWLVLVDGPSELSGGYTSHLTTEELF